jgi:hypothetical protein
VKLPNWAPAGRAKAAMPSSERSSLRMLMRD